MPVGRTRRHVADVGRAVSSGTATVRQGTQWSDHGRWAGVVTPPGLGAASRLLANENECQAGDDEGREEERQEPLARASEGDDLAVGGVEGLGSA